MTQKEELKKEVRALLKERDAVMLAHNYQRDEIQETADITGDSLALSQAAAERPEKVIVFCGVHFMAESAAILIPAKDRDTAEDGRWLPDGRHDNPRRAQEGKGRKGPACLSSPMSTRARR